MDSFARYHASAAHKKSRLPADVKPPPVKVLPPILPSLVEDADQVLSAGELHPVTPNTSASSEEKHRGSAGRGSHESKEDVPGRGSGASNGATATVAAAADVPYAEKRLFHGLRCLFGPHDDPVWQTVFLAFSHEHGYYLTMWGSTGMPVQVHMSTVVRITACDEARGVSGCALLLHTMEPQETGHGAGDMDDTPLLLATEDVAAAASLQLTLLRAINASRFALMQGPLTERESSMFERDDSFADMRLGRLDMYRISETDDERVSTASRPSSSSSSFSTPGSLAVPPGYMNIARRPVLLRGSNRRNPSAGGRK